MSEKAVIDVRGILESHLENVRRGIAENMRANGRNASGRSVASLAVVIESSYRGFLEGDAQWDTMQRGRGAGKVPYGFRDIIKRWIVSKGIAVHPKGKQSQASALNTMAYLISRSIMQKGTKLHQSRQYNDIYDSLIAKEVQLMDGEIYNMVEIEVEKLNEIFSKKEVI